MFFILILAGRPYMYYNIEELETDGGGGGHLVLQ